MTNIWDGVGMGKSRISGFVASLDQRASTRAARATEKPVWEKNKRRNSLNDFFFFFETKPHCVEAWCGPSCPSCLSARIVGMGTMPGVDDFL